MNKVGKFIINLIILVLSFSFTSYCHLDSQFISVWIRGFSFSILTILTISQLDSPHPQHLRTFSTVEGLARE
jgi:hypothetical protein